MKIPFFAHVSASSSLLPVAAGFYQWKKINKPLKVLTIFFGYTSLHHICENALRSTGIPNLFLGDIHQLIEFEIFLFFYWSWTGNQKIRLGLQYIGISYFCFWVINILFYDDHMKFNETIATIAYFFLIVISIYILYELTRKATRPLSSYTMFWIGGSNILYSSGTIILFSFSNSLLQMGISYFIAFWYVNWTLVIISNFMYARSYWCKNF